MPYTSTNMDKVNVSYIIIGTAKAIYYITNWFKGIFVGILDIRFPY